MEFAKRKNFWRDTGGAAMVEFTAAAFTFFVILFGSVEFANAYYQWNAATKAVQWGARVAAVSNPVASDLTALSGVGGSVLPGDPMPTFDRICTASNAAGSLGSCTVVNSYDAAAMQAIVFGRAADGTAYTTCQTTPSSLGMCNLFPRIASAANVSIRYQYTGLGYAGRPGGAVPTITVSLGGSPPLKFEFILIGGLMKVVNSAFPDAIDMPSFATTVTGEDLASAGG